MENWKNKEWLKKELQTKFIKEIAREHNINDSIVHYWCKKYNLKSQYNVDCLWHNKKWIVDELKTKSTTQIAKEQNVYVNTIIRWVHKHNLEDQLNPSWKRKLTQKEVEKRFKEKKWKLIDTYIDYNTEVQAICLYCDKIVYVSPDRIFNGHTRSCGCMKFKLMAKKRMIALKEKSIGYLYPELIHLYSKNNQKSIFTINPGTEYKYKWICEKYGYEHEYETRPWDMIKGCRCPYCSSHQIKIGFNDLASQYPEIAKEWHPTKNGDLKPTQIMSQSSKKIWLICNKCKSEWNVVISNKIKGSRCPCCRKKSKSENKIKQLLDSWDIKYIYNKRFSTCRNKNPLPFDFYLPDYNLLIEFQGEQHYKIGSGYFGGKDKLKQRQKHDRIKKKWAKQNNIKLLVIPYTEKDKLEQILLKNIRGEENVIS